MSYREQFELLLGIINSSVSREEDINTSTSDEELLVIIMKNIILTDILEEFIKKVENIN